MADFKKLDNRAITGQQGIAFIERLCLRLGLAWHPRNASLDAGIDGTIEIRDPETQRATNCILQVQSKAHSGTFTAENDRSFEYLCDARDIEYWLGGNVPVILVVSRPDQDEAYWKLVQDAFGSPESKESRRIVFDKASDKFDEAARGNLIRLAVPRNSGLYFPPLARTEKLYLNLLSIKAFGPTLYLAETEFRFAKEIHARARAAGWDISREWFLASGRILSFHNLREPPWDQLCDVGTVEAFEVQEWARSADPDRHREFVRLLNQTLRAKLRWHGVAYNPKHGCYWFLPPLSPKQHIRRFTYPSIARDATRKVVNVYHRKDGTVKYHRHSAFRGVFIRHQDDWFLEVTPTYFFTHDGREPHRFGDSLLAGIKRLDRNHAVLGQLITWAAFLTQPPDMYGTEYPFLKFGTLQTLELDAGVDDQDWLSRESEADRKALAQQVREEGLFQ